MLRIFAAAFVVMVPAVQASGAIRRVHSGEDLQAALNTARPGDELILDAGATYTGNFVLPATSGTEDITLRSDVPEAALASGARVSPGDAARFAKIVSPDEEPALRTAPRAQHWRIAFLEFPATRHGYGEIIRLGDASPAQSDLSTVPHDLVLDHLYVHGDPLEGEKRGIALNAANVTIRSCYVSDIKAVGQDAQAIAGWNGPGPFTIENNYLEASGENFLLGGADPAIPGLVSADVRFRANHVSRPMAWRGPIVASPSHVTATSSGEGSLPAGTYTYRVVAQRAVGSGTVGHSLPSAAVTATVNGGSVTIAWDPVANVSEYEVFGRTSGAPQSWTVRGTSLTDTGAAGRAGAAPENATEWQVKNLFELKNARHVDVEDNVFENNWSSAQPGYAILLTPRNQDGHCPWCVVESVEFAHNIVRNSSGGFNILGHDSPNQSAQTNGIRIHDNLVYEISTKLGGSGWPILLGEAARDVSFDHNTFDFDGTTLVYAYGGHASAPTPLEGFRFTNNVAPMNTYGINGADASPGTLTLKMYLPGAVIAGNWLSGGSSGKYPSGNRFDAPFDAGVAERGKDYSLRGSLASFAGTDGRRPGADVASLVALLPKVTQGTMTSASTHLP